MMSRPVAGAWLEHDSAAGSRRSPAQPPRDHRRQSNRPAAISAEEDGISAGPVVAGARGAGANGPTKRSAGQGRSPRRYALSRQAGEPCVEAQVSAEPAISWPVRR